MPRRRAKPQPAPAEPERRVVDANQVVAYNFRAARELRGWTQDEAALRLAPYLGHVLPKASISAIERSMDSERRRQYDAQELVAFSLAFELPVVWFLLPPPHLHDAVLEGTQRNLGFLVQVVLGRQGGLDAIRQRLAELADADPNGAGEVVAEASGFPGEVSWEHFERVRREALVALVEQESGEVERLVGELAGVLAKFEDFGLKAYMAAHPPRVYKEISASLLGERAFRALRTADREGGRYTRLLNATLQGGRAIEDAFDVEDPVLVERLAAVFDRVEERLGGAD